MKLLPEVNPDTRPVHLYFAKEKPKQSKMDQINLIYPTLDRKIIFCTEWTKVAKLLQCHPVASICINVHHFSHFSLIEIVSMVATLAKLVNCHNHISVTIGIFKDTPYDIIKESQKSGITGLVPSSHDYPIEETIQALKAQWSGVSYWPKHIIDALPGAVVTAPKQAGEIKLTQRQQQVFNIVTQRGCSNKHLAKIMGLSESTVKLHLSHIFKKYGVKNRSQLIVFAKTVAT